MDTNKRTDLLVTAGQIINGERLQSYGPPQVSFDRIADLWDALGLRVTDWQGVIRPINATDVSLALIQLKVARLVASPDHEDSWIDVAGYAALGGEISLPDKKVETKAPKQYEPPLNFLWVALPGHSEDSVSYAYQCSECLTYMARESVGDHAISVHDIYSVNLADEVTDRSKSDLPPSSERH